MYMASQRGGACAPCAPMLDPPMTSDLILYHQQRNYVTSLIGGSKQNFFDNLASADSEEFWKSMNMINYKPPFLMALFLLSFITSLAPLTDSWLGVPLSYRSLT